MTTLNTPSKFFTRLYPIVSHLAYFLNDDKHERDDIEPLAYGGGLFVLMGGFVWFFDPAGVIFFAIAVSFFFVAAIFKIEQYGSRALDRSSRDWSDGVTMERNEFQAALDNPCKNRLVRKAKKRSRNLVEIYQAEEQAAKAALSYGRTVVDLQILEREQQRNLESHQLNTPGLTGHSTDINQGLADLDRLHIRIQKEYEHEQSLKQTCGDEAAKRYREALLHQQGNESLAQHYQRKVKNQ